MVAASQGKSRPARLNGGRAPPAPKPTLHQSVFTYVVVGVGSPDVMIQVENSTLPGYFCGKAKCDPKTPLEPSVYRKHGEEEIEYH